MFARKDRLNGYPEVYMYSQPDRGFIFQKDGTSGNHNDSLQRFDMPNPIPPASVQFAGLLMLTPCPITFPSPFWQPTGWTFLYFISSSDLSTPTRRKA